jgi:hypothetical protein
MTASGQVINGDMLVDDVSTLNLYLKEKSAFTGSINSSGQSGDVYVEIEDGSTWTLTADSYISGLTVGEGTAIDLNGHKLYGLDSTTDDYTDSKAGHLTATIIGGTPERHFKGSQTVLGSIKQYLAVCDENGKIIYG